MALAPAVNWNDARRVVGLIGEACDDAAPLRRRRERFLEMTLDLIPAKAGVLLCADCRAGFPMRVDVLECHGWMNALEQRVFEEDARCHLYRASPFLQAVWQQTHASGESQTWLRRHLVSDRDWYGSAYVQTVYKPLSIDDILISLTPTSRPGYWRGFALVRAWGDRLPFGVRDRQVSQLLNDGAVSLFKDAPEAGQSQQSRLPRRLEQVKDLLIKGMTEREIAGALDLSPCTVHRHVSRLYRQLAVHSQVELMARELQPT